MHKLVSESVSTLTRREALIEMFACLNDIEKLKEIVDKDPVLDCALFCLSMADPKYRANLDALMNTSELQEDITHCYDDRLRRQRLQAIIDAEEEEFYEDIDT